MITKKINGMKLRHGTIYNLDNKVGTLPHYDSAGVRLTDERKDHDGSYG